MDITDAERIIKTLKDFHLIDVNREIIGNPTRSCNFWAKKISSSIQYDISLLNFLNDDEFLWILLHEESHLRHTQERDTRQSLKLKIDFFLGLVLIVLMIVFFPKNIYPVFPLYLSSIVIVFLIIIAIVSYVDRHWFYHPYYNDEFKADENAVKGIFILKPDVVAWQIMYTSFRAFKKCRENRKKLSILLKIYLILTTMPHPSDNNRIRNVRNLYKKYSTKRSDFSHS